MSIESLVLFAVFIALPLIQQLLQAKRQRDARASRQRQPPPQRPPVPEAAHRPTYDETFDETIEETFEEMPDETLAGTREELIERGAPPMPKTATPAMRALMPQRSMRRRAAVTGLRDRHDLRRAIVLTTILGPCRALESYEPPERG